MLDADTPALPAAPAAISPGWAPGVAPVARSFAFDPAHAAGDRAILPGIRIARPRPAIPASPASVAP